MVYKYNANKSSQKGIFINYKLQLKYVYTFYSFDELLVEDAIEQNEKIADTDRRFTLHQQEDASFILSSLKQDFIGSFVTLTYPNKDSVVIHEGETVELCYDEFYMAMGDNNHNVYYGTAELVKI